MAEDGTGECGLLELCEPLFAYVCTLNRAGRSGASLAPERVRGELQAILDRMRSDAATRRGLTAQFKAVEEPLHGFVDTMIQRSSLPFATAWRPMSWELPDADRAFEDNFYVHLDRALRERGTEADERLAVFYTCLCLGFRGDPHKRTPEFLLSQLDKMLPAVKRHQRSAWAQDGEKLCPAAYEHTDDRVLWQPLGVPLSTMLIVLVLGIAVIFAASSVMFYFAREDLRSALDTINARWQTGPAAGAAEEGG